MFFLSSLYFFFFQRYLSLLQSPWLRDRGLSLVCLHGKGGSPCPSLVLSIPSPSGGRLLLAAYLGIVFSLPAASLSISGHSYRSRMHGVALVRVTSGHLTIMVEIMSGERGSVIMPGEPHEACLMATKSSMVGEVSRWIFHTCSTYPRWLFSLQTPHISFDWWRIHGWSPSSHQTCSQLLLCKSTLYHFGFILLTSY